MNDDKHEFKSGATSSGKLPSYDLIPRVFLDRVAERFTLGAEKHGKFNYRKGLEDKEFIIDRLNHAFIHLKNAIDLIENGHQYLDDDLGGVAVNVAMAMEYQTVNQLGKLNIETMITDHEFNSVNLSFCHCGHHISRHTNKGIFR